MMGNPTMPENPILKFGDIKDCHFDSDKEILLATTLMAEGYG
jgi:hypothetical protein